VNLLWALVVREIKGRYRRSLLGPFWAILQPLMYMVVFTFIQRMLHISSDGAPYVIFSYTALVPWTFFSNAVTRCGPSITGNAGIIRKMEIAREVFPLAGVLTSLVDFLLSGLVLLGMMLVLGLPFGVGLVWLPVMVVITATLAMGVGLGVAALGTYRHDVIFAIPFVLQLWLLASPIMYPLGTVPEGWRSLYQLNPMVGIIDGFRNVVLQGVAPDPVLITVSALGTAVVWLLAWPLFRYTSQYFADVV
jgi:lipopolysaccharide transport system permease protein